MQHYRNIPWRQAIKSKKLKSVFEILHQYAYPEVDAVLSFYQTKFGPACDLFLQLNFPKNFLYEMATYSSINLNVREKNYKNFLEAIRDLSDPLDQNIMLKSKNRHYLIEENFSGYSVNDSSGVEKEFFTLDAILLDLIQKV